MSKLVGLVLLVAGGCYGGEYRSSGGYYGATTSAAVTVAPPEPIVENVTVAPFPGAVWTAGYWDWQPGTRRYVWTGGRWSNAPRAGVVYYPPRWQRNNYGYVRTPGRWVPGQTTDQAGRRVWYDSLGRAHYM